MDIKVFTLLTSVVTMLLSGVLAVPAGNSSGCCSAEFQRKFHELINLKGSCRDATMRDCCEIANGMQIFGESSMKNTVFPINDVCVNRSRPKFTNPASSATIQARCDTKNGWLVILRRKADVSPLVNFTREWVEYENGFGTLETEFWYGLKNIHCLTERDEVEMMIELKRNDGTGITWIYETFRVNGPETNYVLHIGQAERLEGTGGDAMAYHNYSPFSTIDRDNDEWSHGNCANRSGQTFGNGGGWWYKYCHHAGLTFPHTGNHKLSWYDGASYIYFPHVEMKIRPKTCPVSNKQPKSCE